jgi:CubicO group peptidase (beta-lactamase class C family)
MTVTIHGELTSRFEPVRAAFEANFAERREVGAAVAVYVDGRSVVDLWAGVADPVTDRPWEEDTLAPVYSTTKGVSTIAAHRLAQRGQLDVDAPAADYWPEFAV